MLDFYSIAFFLSTCNSHMYVYVFQLFYDIFQIIAGCGKRGRTNHPEVDFTLSFNEMNMQAGHRLAYINSE